MVIDSISLPRETLTRLSGDCDDLTVLFCTMLQSVGIDTALVTTPGHIYCAFNTGTPSRDFEMLHPDREMFIEIDGSLWVPVEITLIGRKSFPEAWSTGIAEYRQYDAEADKRGFYKTVEAQQLYRPVALRETDLGLQYGDTEDLLEEYKTAMGRITSAIVSPLREKAESSNNAGGWNKYGVAAAKLGAYRDAEQAFQKVIALRSDYFVARLNLGSVFFLSGKYEQSLSAFKQVEEMVQGGGSMRDNGFSLFVNLSKAHYALTNYTEAEKYFEKASDLDRESAEKYAYLLSPVNSEGGRASDAGDEVPILFVEE